MCMYKGMARVHAHWALKINVSAIFAGFSGERAGILATNVQQGGGGQTTMEGAAVAPLRKGMPKNFA